MYHYYMKSTAINQGTKTMSKDTFRSKTYKAEQAFFARPENKAASVQLNEQETKALIKELNAHFGTCVSVKFNKPEEFNGMGKGTSAFERSHGYTQEIYYRDTTNPLWLTLHEFAHALVDNEIWDNNLKHEELVQSHGAGFIGHYIEVVRWFNAEIGAAFQAFWTTKMKRQVTSVAEEIETALNNLDTKLAYHIKATIKDINKHIEKYDAVNRTIHITRLGAEKYAPSIFDLNRTWNGESNLDAATCDFDKKSGEFEITVWDQGGGSKTTKFNLNEIGHVSMYSQNGRGYYESKAEFLS
jgi:hypothetical protein